MEKFKRIISEEITEKKLNEFLKDVIYGSFSKGILPEISGEMSRKQSIGFHREIFCMNYCRNSYRSDGLFKGTTWRIFEKKNRCEDLMKPLLGLFFGEIHWRCF